MNKIIYLPAPAPHSIPSIICELRIQHPREIDENLISRICIIKHLHLCSYTEYITTQTQN